MKAELEGNGKSRALLKQAVVRHLGGGSSGSQWCRDGRFVTAWKSTFEQLGIHIELPETDPKPPARQLKRMSHPTRAGAALVFVLAMLATLVCALVLPRTTRLSTSAISFLVVTCIVVQFMAFFWYCLSYIPYGRRMFKACCASVMSEES